MELLKNKLLGSFCVSNNSWDLTFGSDVSLLLGADLSTSNPGSCNCWANLYHIIIFFSFQAISTCINLICLRSLVL